MFRRHPLVTALSAAYVGFVLWLTLRPSPYGAGTATLLRRFLRWAARHSTVDWITFDVLERGANVALFVPIGVLFLLLAGRRFWWAALLAGVGMSVAIEAAQGMWLSSRVADPGDVLTNGIGTAVGIVLAIVLTWRTERQHAIIVRQRRQLAEAQRHIDALRDSHDARTDIPPRR